MTIFAERLIAIVREQLGVRELTEDSDIHDLGAAELDVLEIIMMIEDEFHIDIDDDKFEELKTIRSMAEYVRAACIEQGKLPV